MAVQAQHPANVFRGRNVLDEYVQQFQNRENLSGNVFAAGSFINYDWNNNNNNNKARQQILNGAVFSDPESELTCNVSASRKRNREDGTVDHHHHHHHQMQPYQHHLDLQHQHQQQQQVSQQLRYAKLPKCHVLINSSNTSTTALSYDESRLHESGGTSTSGRSSSIVLVSPQLATAPHHQDLNSHLLHQNLEIDALILLHNEKLRSALEETRKRHCRSLLSSVEQQVLNRLEEKETELQNASRRNSELEEKIKQLSAENQIWFNVAKNNEAIVSSLKSTLEQILLQNNNKGAQTIIREEGFGDSEGLVLNGLAGKGGAAAAVADHDAQSCCYEGTEVEAEEDKTGYRSVAEQKTIQENRELKQRKSCKVCGENEVSVLLLPCRHLCLCKDCESKLDYCPICKSMKNASLQIFMS
ncbi:zinc finger protein [Macleaya cordata]|uniref:Zinc finger protein n=1 Tax=Macleaya cordata TaxID=56857 RepID=A0A200QH15_MACCD|nr:zinc finger protein [Macleaya cordata]